MRPKSSTFAQLFSIGISNAYEKPCSDYSTRADQVGRSDSKIISFRRDEAVDIGVS
jgi:hypothetical protein